MVRHRLQAVHQEGPSITLQVLDKIKQAELEVEAILKKARETREATVTKARQDALRHLRNAEETARLRYDETITAARRAVEAQTAALTREADAAVTTQQEAFERHVAASRERIVRIFERAAHAQD